MGRVKKGGGLGGALLAVVALAQPSWATPGRPSLAPRTPPEPFRNDTSSAVLPDVNDPERFYVLPPGEGTVDAMDMVFGANNVHCEQLFDLQESSRELTRRLSDLASEAEPIEGRLAELVAARREVVRLYEHYARLDGGAVRLTYSAPWEANIFRLLWLNEGLSFEKIATSEAQVRGSLVPGMGLDGYLALLPMFTRVYLDGEAYAPGDMNRRLAAFPAVHVEAVFSLVASCAMGHPDRVDLDQGADRLPRFALSVSYAYPVVSRYRGIVHYNMWRLLDFLIASEEWSAEELRPELIRAIPSAAFRLSWLDADVPLVTREAARREHLGQVLDQALQWAAVPGGKGPVRPWPLARPSSSGVDESEPRRAALTELARRWPPPWWSGLREQGLDERLEVSHEVTHQRSAVTVYASF